MRRPEILSLLRVAKPPPPYGVKRLARCYSFEDVTRRARRLPLGWRAYLETGGEGEYTLYRNRAAFDLIEFLPNEPRDVSHVDTSNTVLGQRIPLPFALSPIGAPRMFHQEGELAVARAARHYGIPYGLSTLATPSVEDVAAQTSTPLWFQLYIWGHRGEIREAITRARASRFSALLFRSGTVVRSKREREKRAGLELPTPEPAADHASRRRAASRLGLALPHLPDGQLAQHRPARSAVAGQDLGHVPRHRAVGGPGLDPPAAGRADRALTKLSISALSQPPGWWMASHRAGHKQACSGPGA